MQTNHSPALIQQTNLVVRTPPPSLYKEGGLDFSKMAVMGGWKVLLEMGENSGMGGDCKFLKPLELF